MTFAAGNNAAVYVNGYDLSAYFRSTTQDGTAAAYNVTTYGKSSMVYVGGLKDGVLSAEGFYDGTIGTVDEALAAALGVPGDSIWNILFPSDVFGGVGRGFLAVDTKHTTAAPVDGVVTLAVGAQSKSGFEPVKTLHAMASNGAGTTNGASINNLAASLAGGTGYLQVPVEVASTATIKIQHSTDDSTWVDLITFTAVTAAPNAQRVEVTGTIRQYLRAQVVATGGAITSHISFARN